MQNPPTYVSFWYESKSQEEEDDLSFESDIGLQIDDCISPVLYIEILQSNISGNSGVAGGGITVRTRSSVETIHFRIVACTFYRNKAKVGAGLYALLWSGIKRLISYDIQIVETDFSENAAGEIGGGILFNVQNSDFQKEELTVLLNNCSFRDCRADVGAAVSVDYCLQTLSHNHHVTTTCLFPVSINLPTSHRKHTYRHCPVFSQ